MGASSTGWIKLSQMLFTDLAQTIGGFREIHTAGIVQVSAGLIGFDFEKRKEVAWRLLRESEIPVVVSYPRICFGGDWVNDQDLAKELVNQVLVYTEYLFSSKRSPIARQPSDLKAILHELGAAAYIPTAVMTPNILKPKKRKIRMDSAYAKDHREYRCSKLSRYNCLTKTA